MVSAFLAWSECNELTIDRPGELEVDAHGCSRSLQHVIVLLYEDPRQPLARVVRRHGGLEVRLQEGQ